MKMALKLLQVLLLAQAPSAADLPPVILNEIHYHPPNDADAREEFVELHNRTGSDVDIQGWEFTRGIRYRFDRSTGPASIPARGFLLLARNPALLARTTGIPVSRIAGPFSGKLSNNGDRLILVDARGDLVEDVEYSQDGAWPARADGLGASLQRVTSEAPGNLPQNWAVGSPQDPSRQKESGPVLMEAGSEVCWFENRDGSDPRFRGSLPWFHPEFNGERNGFKNGKLPVGYDLLNQRAGRWIQTRATPLRGLHSILIRIPFTVSREQAAQAPTLSMDWDDGFIAWLNGVEIARKGMRLPAGVVPPPGRFYLAETESPVVEEREAPFYRRVWTGAPGTLRPGRNILCIANYNGSSRSTDLFCTARLALGSGGAADFTPGRENSVACPALPPLVTLLERVPREPRPSDEVILRARVEGATEKVELFYDSGSGETSLPLQDDGRTPDLAAGDGIFTARIPPALDQTVVRFRIAARGKGGGVFHYPRRGNPSPYTGYYVLEPSRRGSEDLQTYHILWTGSLSCSRGVWRKGATFIHQGTAHLDVGLKYRGLTSCGMPKSGLKVNFNRGDLFQNQKQLNLLACWQDRSLLREKLAWDLFRHVGHPHCRAEMAAVYARGNRFHGLFVALEEPGKHYLRRNGINPGDILWKCNSSFLGPESGSQGSYTALTNSEDVESASAVLELERKLSSLKGRELLEYILNHIDVEALLDYQAVKCLISDEDGFTKNWFLCQSSGKDARENPIHRWTVHPWDLDLSFGQASLNDEEIHTEKHPLLGTADHPRHGSHGMRWNGLLEAVFGRETDDYFTKALYGRIWGLLEEKFHPRAMGEEIDRIDASTIDLAHEDLRKWPRWGLESQNPVVHRENLRTYVSKRCQFLREFLTEEHQTSAKEVGRWGIFNRPPRVAAGKAPPPAKTYRTFRYSPAPRMKITEIHYNPGGDEELEFIEIRNLEKTDVHISGWNIPAVGFVFPRGSEIPASAVFVVARDPEKLTERHRDLPGRFLFGPYPGRLSNQGEDLRLRDSGLHRGKQYHPETIDAVKYRDSSPWPAQADGAGRSLELGELSLDNDLPESWRASREPGGSPGK